jgi:hypothetical protein
MSHEHDYDDGLVHSHGWATEPPPSVGMLLRPANDEARRGAKLEEAHDDGLVHGHAWASAEARRQA